MYKRFGCFMAIFFASLSIASFASTYYYGYLLDRDIDGWKSRAQVAGDADKMLEYLLNVRAGMEKWGMTEGSAALLWQTPDNNMALIYGTVGDYVFQAKVLTTQDKGSGEYHESLDNMRGNIRELKLYTSEYWGVHQGLVFYGVAIVSLFLAILTMWGSEWRSATRSRF